MSLTEKERIQQRNWRVKNRESWLPRQRSWRQALKLEVLTRYGKNGTLQCCWDGCGVVDIDVLTLDHVNNDGRKDRLKRGINIYSSLRQDDFPDGYQTLCANHQLKKEILRKEALPMGVRRNPTFPSPK